MMVIDNDDDFDYGGDLIAVFTSRKIVRMLIMSYHFQEKT